MEIVINNKERLFLLRIDILYCEDCGEECEIVEETFGYSGTHCTNGKSGTHHTGVYLSKCCLADFTDNSEQEG